MQFCDFVNISGHYRQSKTKQASRGLPAIAELLVAIHIARAYHAHVNACEIRSLKTGSAHSANVALTH